MALSSKIYQWEQIDPSTEFSKEDYFNFNGSFNTIKFNPNHKIAARKATGIDIYSRPNDSYFLYELNNTSIVRPFSTKLLYNKQTGDWKTLLGSNAEIYDLNEEWKLFDSLSINFEDAQQTEAALNLIKKYLYLFLDHTRGKNGSFYVCETFEDIKESVNIYYKLDENAEALAEQREHLEKLRKENKMTKLRIAINEHLKNPSLNETFKIQLLKDNDADKYICTAKVFVVFKNAIFETKISIARFKPNRQITISDEKLGMNNSKVFGVGAKEHFSALGYEPHLPPFFLLT